jgi:alkylation response protein AidB-like acyl-CoA dehydrogenase
MMGNAMDDFSNRQNLDRPRPREGFSQGTVAGLVETARKLRPLLQAEAPQGEILRSPTPAVDRVLKDSGLLIMLLPLRWGGGGLSVGDYARVMIELAKGDPSAAWVTQIINGTTWVGSLTTDATQEALFGEGPKLVCGAYNPPGRARRVDGGYVVSGAWPYTSGSRQADWAQCGVLTDEPAGTVTAVLNMAYIPFTQIEMRDSWFVSGLQGTGSDTSVATEVFVPDARMVTMDKPVGHYEPGKRHWGAASDFFPVVPTVRAAGLAQLVGAAEAMLEVLEADATGKPIITTTFRTRAESAVHLHDLGRVAARIDAARALLFSACEMVDSAAALGGALSDREKAQHKAQCAQVIELVHGAIETIMFMAGSSAFALAHPLNRYWRDIHVALRHITNLPALGYEIYGRERVGALPNITPSNGF